MGNTAVRQRRPRPVAGLEDGHGQNARGRGGPWLADRAGRVASFKSVPWKLYPADTVANAGEFQHCIAAIQRDPADYTLRKCVAVGREMCELWAAWLCWGQPNQWTLVRDAAAWPETSSPVSFIFICFSSLPTFVLCLLARLQSILF